MSKLHGLKMKHWRKFLIKTSEVSHQYGCFELSMKDVCEDIRCEECPIHSMGKSNLYHARREYIDRVSKEVGL